MNRSTPRCWSTATRSRLASVPEFVALALGIYYDSGSLSFASGRLGILTALFDRLGRHEPAAIISGFADAPVALATFPEIAETTVHLRQVFGDETFGSFAQAGANMINATKAAYALDQIDLARADLLRVEESP